MPEQKRQIAYKIRIKDILQGEYVKEEGWTPNYVSSDGKKLSRVNLIATVVAKDGDSNYQSILLDDGTGRISARAFEQNINLEDSQIGDIVLIVGRPREYGDERYMLVEIIKKIKDNNWIEVRKLELGVPTTPEPIKQDPKPVKVDEINNPSEKIIDFIRSNDSGEGVELTQFLGSDNQKFVDMLLKEGEIFEIKPGRFKVLE